MREFFQSCTTLAFSLSLLTVELVNDVTSMKGREFSGAATRALDSVSNAALDQLGPRLRFTFDSLNDIQRGVVGIMFDFSLAMARMTVNRLGDGIGPGEDRSSNGIIDGGIQGGGGNNRNYGAVDTRPTGLEERLRTDRSGFIHQRN